MTVYLLHFDQPLPHGISRQGNAQFTRHYLGFAEDLVGRLLEHKETTWTPPEEEGMPGTTHGHGATLVGVANSRGIPWRLARTWDGADRDFERRLKNCKMGPDLCPICNPRAMNKMNLEDLRQ